MNPVVFINAAPGLAIRERESEKSKALSHAAKVSHGPRKQKSTRRAPKFNSVSLNRMPVLAPKSRNPTGSLIHGCVESQFQNANKAHSSNDSLLLNDYGQLRGLRIDPFGVISPYARAAFDYYTQIVVPSNAAIWKIFDIEAVVEHNFLQLVQSHLCAMPCILAPKIILDRARDPHGPVSDRFVQQHTLGLSRVREHLSRSECQVNASLILAVVNLAV
jgi:hypothetical protein